MSRVISIAKSLIVGVAIYSLLSPACMAIPFGGQSMVQPLKTVIVREPSKSFANADPGVWHYTAKPNLKNAIREHKAFVKTLEQQGVEVLYHQQTLPELADSIYVHDPVLMTNQGAVILRMGKELRRGEESGLEQTLAELDVPIAFRMHGQATAEAGDMLWLDDKTLLVGRSFRTNQQGVDQLTDFLGQSGVKVIAYDLPVDLGKEACLHLQSFISLVSYDKAVVYRKLMPVAMLEALNDRNFTLIDVPDDEYMTMGPNILAIKPNQVLTIEGNPKTKERLEQAGVEVLTYKGKEISLKAEGGATCLTRPVLRA